MSIYRQVKQPELKVVIRVYPCSKDNNFKRNPQGLSGEPNYFNNRTTNALTECFNAKLKKFRVDLRGMNDIPFFLYRVVDIYAAQ
ncbi:MAG: hypothetical protein ACRCZY_10975 [Phocaeicola sp.]